MSLAQVGLPLLAIIAFIILTFLPAIIELKKPKDPGPRLISNGDSRLSIPLNIFLNIPSIDDASAKLLTPIISELLDFLPDIEVSQIT